MPSAFSTRQKSRQIEDSLSVPPAAQGQSRCTHAVSRRMPSPFSLRRPADLTGASSQCPPPARRARTVGPFAPLSHKRSDVGTRRAEPGAARISGMFGSWTAIFKNVLSQRERRLTGDYSTLQRLYVASHRPLVAPSIGTARQLSNRSGLWPRRTEGKQVRVTVSGPFDHRRRHGLGLDVNDGDAGGPVRNEPLRARE
jgi:hypothetical protein